MFASAPAASMSSATSARWSTGLHIWRHQPATRRTTRSPSASVAPGATVMANRRRLPDSGRHEADERRFGKRGGVRPADALERRGGDGDVREIQIADR